MGEQQRKLVLGEHGQQETHRHKMAVQGLSTSVAANEVESSCEKFASMASEAEQAGAEEARGYLETIKVAIKEAMDEEADAFEKMRSLDTKEAIVAMKDGYPERQQTLAQKLVREDGTELVELVVKLLTDQVRAIEAPYDVAKRALQHVVNIQEILRIDAAFNPTATASE